MDKPQPGEFKRPPNSAEEMHRRLSELLTGPTAETQDAFYVFADDPELGRVRLSNYSDFDNLENTGRVSNSAEAREHATTLTPQAPK